MMAAGKTTHGVSSVNLPSVIVKYVVHGKFSLLS